MGRQLEFDWEELDRKAVLELWTPDEIYDCATTELLPQFHEDDRVERKSGGMHDEGLAIYVCMWSNTPPDGGILIIGMEDDGTISGCQSRTDALIRAERRIRNELVPDARFSSKRIPTMRADGQPDYLLLFRVQYRDDKVVELHNGDAWIRWADAKHLLTAEEKRELQIDRGQVQFELESCRLAWPGDFRLDDIKAWVSAICKKKGLVSELNLIDVLVRHRMGKMRNGDFVPNNACALLFANDPQTIVPGCMIRFERIEGCEVATGRNRNVVKDIPIVGTIPQIITETFAVLDNQLRTYSRLGPDGKFYTAPEYPEEAWQEAVVNACVHRSYSLHGANIFIRMFDDKLVIDSPGPFPASVTPENIYENHYRRNWWLMDAMYFLEYVRCENEGVKRIRNSMKDMNLPAPEFEQKQIGGGVVRVTLRNNQNLRQIWVDTDVSEVIGIEAASRLNDFEKRIVNHIVEYGTINVSAAMQLMPKPRWHTARKSLLGLVEAAIVKHVSRYPRDPNSYFTLAGGGDGTDSDQPSATHS